MRESRKERIGEVLFTMSFVPETKMVGEKATRRARSTLLVVDPHSRSARPDTMASMRVCEVTGSQAIASSRPTTSPMASTSLRQSSIE